MYLKLVALVAFKLIFEKHGFFFLQVFSFAFSLSRRFPFLITSVYVPRLCMCKCMYVCVKVCVQLESDFALKSPLNNEIFR